MQIVRSLWLRALLLAPLCWLNGCVSNVRSFVTVDPLDLHEGYREYSDSLVTSGRLSLATRQALNLVPEAAAARDTAAQLAALGASERIDPATRAFARSELALRAAQQLDRNDPVAARLYYLVAAREAARLLFPEGKMIHIDPFDQKYRLASGFYSLAAGRYFLLLMASGRSWTGDITEVTPAGTFGVTFDNDDSDLYAYFFSDFSLAWGYRIKGLRNRYTRDGIGIPLVARRAPGTSFPLERYFPAGGYIAPITAYLRFDPDDPTASAERVRVGLADARLAEYVCFGQQSLPVAADFTAPYARANHTRSFAGRGPCGAVRQQRARQPAGDHHQRPLGSFQDSAGPDSWSRVQRRSLARTHQRHSGFRGIARPLPDHSLHLRDQ